MVASLVAAAAGYALLGDVAATAGPVPEFVRAETPIAPADPAAPLASDLTAAGPDVVAGDDGLLRVREEAAATRSSDRSPLPGCDGVPPETPQPNGELAEEHLCTIWDGSTQMRADAAVALAVLNERYRAENGADLCVTSGYRTYGQQEALRRQKPGLAAPAGTSEHGNGLAVDLCGGVEREGAAYYWLADNAPSLGYDNPDWAKRGGSGPYEPWHWEYVTGQW